MTTTMTVVASVPMTATATATAGRRRQRRRRRRRRPQRRHHLHLPPRRGMRTSTIARDDDGGRDRRIPSSSASIRTNDSGSNRVMYTNINRSNNNINSTTFLLPHPPPSRSVRRRRLPPRRPSRRMPIADRPSSVTIQSHPAAASTTARPELRRS